MTTARSLNSQLSPNDSWTVDMTQANWLFLKLSLARLALARDKFPVDENIKKLVLRSI